MKHLPIHLKNSLKFTNISNILFLTSSHLFFFSCFLISIILSYISLSTGLVKCSKYIFIKIKENVPISKIIKWSSFIFFFSQLTKSLYSGLSILDCIFSSKIKESGLS